MKKIIIIGAGGHAKSCIDIIELTKKYEIIGLIDKTLSKGYEISGYCIIGDDSALTILGNDVKYAFIAIGQIKSPNIRIRLYNFLTKHGFKLPRIISPNSYLSKHSIIKNGSILMHNTIINSHSSIGNNCIINNNALIEHDVIVEDHCHISTGAIINGGAYVGEKTFIGSGAVINQNIRIGDSCIIASGAIINEDIPSNSLIKNEQK